MFLLTNLIQLHQKVLCIFLIQQRLGSATVRAITLGEDDDVVLVDDLLCFALCGGHAVGRGGAGGGEEGAGEGAEERQFGGGG